MIRLVYYPETRTVAVNGPGGWTTLRNLSEDSVDALTRALGARLEIR